MKFLTSIPQNLSYIENYNVDSEFKNNFYIISHMLFPESEHPELSMIFTLYKKIIDETKTTLIRKFIFEYEINKKILSIISNLLQVEILI